MFLNTNSAGGDAPRIDPEDLLDNPEQTLASLRQHHPIIQLGHSHYMALREAEVFSYLQDGPTRQFRGEEYLKMNKVPEGGTADFLKESRLISGARTELALRAVVKKCFTRDYMTALRAQVRDISRKTVSELPRGLEYDFSDKMSARFSGEITASFLGLSGRDMPGLSTDIHRLARAFNPIYPIDEHDRINSASSALFEYVEDQVRLRMEDRQSDLLTDLIADWRKSQFVSFDNLVRQILGLIFGITIAMKAGLGMAVGLLLQHPEQWHVLTNNPKMIPRAVAETLRLWPPVGSIPRYTLCDVSIGKTVLPAGVLLQACTLSAMRDASRFTDPDQFNIHRDEHPHIRTAFGIGPHSRVIEELVRLGMEEGLASLIADAPELALHRAPKLLGFGYFREITPLVVRSE